MRRTEPWIWTFALLVALFVAGWLDTPQGNSLQARPPNPDRQIVGFTVFLLPVTVIVGVLFAFIPPRHRILRTMLLVPLALYVGGLGALLVFAHNGLSDTGLNVGLTPDAVPTEWRIVGGVAQALVWFSGRIAEEVTVAVRRYRRAN